MSKKIACPSIERVQELLDYDPDCGILVWRKSTSNRVKVGDVAGHLDRNGYVIVSVDGVRYLAHRLIWLLFHGEWPDQIDHRDLNRSNNSIDNLRPSTQSENLHNIGLSSHNTSGLKGVSPGRRGNWRAQIAVDGKRIYLGEFKTKEAAHASYMAAAEHHFGEFARAA